jgi:hypothetical protein
MANASLLRRTLQYIKEHPEKHNQSYWFARGDCGTTACFAGTAARLSGYKPYWLTLESTEYAVHDDAEFPSAENISVEILGQQLLELSSGEADRLFHGDNTLTDLERIVDGIIASSGAEQ